MSSILGMRSNPKYSVLVMLLVLAVSVWLAFSTLANANSDITYNFTGTLVSNSGNNQNLPNVGTPFTGSFTYDSSQADTNPNASIGQYSGTMTISAPGGSENTPFIRTYNNTVIQVRNGQYQDRFYVQGLDNYNPGSGQYERVTFFMVDNSASAFSTDALPGPDLDLADCPVSCPFWKYRDL